MSFHPHPSPEFDWVGKEFPRYWGGHHAVVIVLVGRLSAVGGVGVGTRCAGCAQGLSLWAMVNLCQECGVFMRDCHADWRVTAQGSVPI